MPKNQGSFTENLFKAEGDRTERKQKQKGGEFYFPGRRNPGRKSTQFQVMTAVRTHPAGDHCLS